MPQLHQSQPPSYVSNIQVERSASKILILKVLVQRSAITLGQGFSVGQKRRFLLGMCDSLLHEVLLFLKLTITPGSEVLISFQDAAWDSKTCRSTVLGPRHLATPCSLPLVLSVSSEPWWQHHRSSVPLSTWQQIFLQDPELYHNAGSESYEHRLDYMWD